MFTEAKNRLTSLGVVEGVALELGNYIILADPHIGYSAKLIAYSTQAKRRLVNYEIKYINQVLSLTNKKTLIFLGDIKEHIGTPPKYITNAIQTLFNKLCKQFEKIYITRGNHDGNLVDILDKLNNPKIRIANYVVLHISNRKIVLTHGHMKLPTDEIKTADIFIIGHLHPLNVIGEKTPIGLKIKLEDDISKKLIILPSINPRLSGIPINKLDITATIKRILGAINSYPKITLYKNTKHAPPIIDIMTL